MESYELMFELSHKVRLDSIHLLQKTPKRLSSIADELDITTSEAARHLERLCKANIIEKRADSNYHLTPFGRIILLDLPKINFLTNNIKYFQTHDLSPIPIDIQSLDPISKCEFSHGTLENISIIEDITNEAEKFVWSMSDQIFRGLKKQIAKKLDKGIEFKMIFQEDVITAIDVIMSLGDQGKITYTLQWYDAISTATYVRNWWVESINDDIAHGTCGFVYEAGSRKYDGFRGNHIHLPSDTRIIYSPEYLEYFWICL